MILGIFFHSVVQDPFFFFTVLFRIIFFTVWFRISFFHSMVQDQFFFHSIVQDQLFFTVWFRMSRSFNRSDPELPQSRRTLLTARAKTASSTERRLNRPALWTRTKPETGPGPSRTPDQDRAGDRTRTGPGLQGPPPPRAALTSTCGVSTFTTTKAREIQHDALPLAPPLTPAPPSDPVSGPAL